jgi:uroporphyrinogen-III synthase
MTAPLAGRSILVTRPAHQAAALAQGIGDAGGDAVLFPALEIRAVVDDTLTALIDRLHEFHAAIFISPNAAQFGAHSIVERRTFPAPLQYFALGPGTARELDLQGLHHATAPDGQDTEALLKLPELQNVAGKRIVIFRGVGGRELLAESLRLRGAMVEYAECYRRVLPHADAGPLRARWARGEIHAVTITSAETLHNLAVLLGEAGTALLRATPVFAPHEKIAEAARRFGIHRVIATPGGDAGLLQGLVNWFRAHP